MAPFLEHGVVICKARKVRSNTELEAPYFMKYVLLSISYDFEEYVIFCFIQEPLRLGFYRDYGSFAISVGIASSTFIPRWYSVSQNCLRWIRGVIAVKRKMNYSQFICSIASNSLGCRAIHYRWHTSCHVLRCWKRSFLRLEAFTSNRSYIGCCNNYIKSKKQH